MTRQTHRLLIGALGWQHEAWQESFYPDDLPPEWRLGYYSNEFPLAAITERERRDEAGLIDELADCREDLLALLVVRVENGADPALAAACRLREQLPREAGLLLQFDPTAAGDPDHWLAQVQAVTGEIPLCVDALAPLEASWQAALRGRDTGWSWNAQTDREGLAVGPLAVMTVAGRPDARLLRERIEAALAVNTGERNVALLFAGAPPDIEAMRQAKTIEELM